MPYDEKNNKPTGEKPWEKKTGKNVIFQVTEVNFKKISPKGGTGSAGSIRGVAFRSGKLIKEKDFEVGLMGLPGLPYAASLTKAGIKEAGIQAKVLSPITFADLDFDPFDGFVGRGKILPSAKLLERVDIDVVLDDRGVGIDATIMGGDLNLPGPFQVTGGSITLHAGTDGLAG